uniref:Uncharacterized protein n=1 Tax=Rhipicephalus zambeziensis TaxID=60191 RepID=A0A224Y6M7_9ACAR
MLPSFQFCYFFNVVTHFHQRQFLGSLLHTVRDIQENKGTSRGVSLTTCQANATNSLEVCVCVCVQSLISLHRPSFCYHNRQVVQSSRSLCLSVAHHSVLSGKCPSRIIATLKK